MFGHQLLLPIPDIDRTQHFLVLGANPMASNGSLMTVPDFRGRLKALRARGGRMVVVDPRRSETADVADRHHFIRPGSDILLLLALLHVAFRDGLVRPGAVAAFSEGLDSVAAAVAEFLPAVVSQATGIAAADIEQMAAEFLCAPSAVAYGRMGTSTQAFGSHCQWAINLLNLVSGNLDRAGGAMFTRPALDLLPSQMQPGHHKAWHSRVSRLPETAGELPVAALAEEMLTPGEGQVRALVTVAGNPVLSTPNGAQLERGLAQLDFMVSVDLYLNETTRHAHMILPPTCAVEHDHYDLVFHHLAVRNTARWSPALFAKPPGMRHDWEIFNGLAAAYRTAHDRSSPPSIGARLKRLPQTTRQQLRPDQLLGLGLRAGPYGRLRGEQRVTLRRLRESPHGIDLGPLQPCLPQRLFTPDQRIRCAIPELLGDMARVRGLLATPRAAPLSLIGRRHLRSNNSWMHNSHRLVKGKPRCQLLMHPDDARSRSLQDGMQVRVSSRTGTVEATLMLSDELMPGVVSLPHGWGHDRPGTRLGVARAHAGVSLNDLTDPQRIDPVSGNAALNGVPVEVAALA